MSKLLVGYEDTKRSKKNFDIYYPELSDKEKSFSILNIFIDDKRLDKILADIIDWNYFGLIPSLCDLYDEEYIVSKREKEYIISKLSYENGEYTLPILLCPDDFDFSCTTILVEIIIKDSKVIWNRFGLNRGEKPDGYYAGIPIEDYDKIGNEVIGKEVLWFDNMPKYEFLLEEYKVEMSKFLDILNKPNKKDRYRRYLSLEDLKDDLFFLPDAIIEDKKLIIKFHSDFEISIKNNIYFDTYINRFFHYDIEEQDIWYFLKEIADDMYIIVQYNHKHGFLNRSRFRFYLKHHFSIEKIKYKKDINNIFDIYGIMKFN